MKRKYLILIIILLSIITFVGLSVLYTIYSFKSLQNDFDNERQNKMVKNIEDLDQELVLGDTRVVNKKVQPSSGHCRGGTMTLIQGKIDTLLYSSESQCVIGLKKITDDKFNAYVCIGDGGGSTECNYVLVRYDLSGVNIPVIFNDGLVALGMYYEFGFLNSLISYKSPLSNDLGFVGYYRISYGYKLKNTIRSIIGVPLRNLIESTLN